MLVLTRRAQRDPDDTIILYDKRTGETYRVVVTEIHGDNVRLGVVAPKDVQVHRKEIYDQIQQENRASAAVGLPSTVGKTLEQIRAMQRPSQDCLSPGRA